MNKEEILEKLYDLKNKFLELNQIKIQYDELQSELLKLINELECAESFNPTNLVHFDEQNLEKFIVSEIGNPPRYKISSIFKKAQSKEEYDRLSCQYKLNYSICLKKYYEEFSFEREVMKKKDLKEKENLINNVNKKINETECKINEYNLLLNKIKDEIENNNIVTDKYKYYKNVCDIIDLIENDRFNSIMDAINYIEIFYSINELRDNVNEKINDLQSKIELLDSNVTDLTIDIEKIESNMLKINSEIDSLENEISRLDIKINYVDSCVD